MIEILEQIGEIILIVLLWPTFLPEANSFAIFILIIVWNIILIFNLEEIIKRLEMNNEN